MIDYGLVRRDRCACGLVIVIASNAWPALITATMSYHNGTPEHRYWATYTQPSVDPAAELRRGTDRNDYPVTGPVRADEVSSPRQRSGVTVSPDGYDFDVGRTETGRKP